MNNWRISCTRLRDRPVRAAAVLAVLTAALALASLCLGAVELSPAQVLEALRQGDSGSVAARVMLYSRLPRTCGSLLTGAALAVAGVLVMIGSVIFYFAGWVCPYCGGHLGRIDSGGNYCRHCGKRLDFDERTGRKP